MHQICVFSSSWSHIVDNDAVSLALVGSVPVTGGNAVGNIGMSWRNEHCRSIPRYATRRANTAIHCEGNPKAWPLMA